MKTLTEKEAQVLNVIKECAKESDNGKEFIIEDVANQLNLSEYQVSGVCSSLQKKGFVDMFNGDCYYDGEIINEPNQEEQNQEPGTKEEVEITEDDIKWIGDNIFHLVYSELIKSKGDDEYITFNHKKNEFIKRSWDEKSLFILSGSRVYPLDAVEKYLDKDGRTIEDVFELWTKIAIEDYNQ
jgi:hypothetical protein